MNTKKLMTLSSINNIGIYILIVWISGMNFSKHVSSPMPTLTYD